ncbi:MAG TPA: putative toxin-antitoxin system toxin component, PIN family [Candidatus Fraserbacteria bacterium]|nr:putative toxin-antitoxin system toxin component, PIN family [Candidatus Fraserbacteria bacterium]
MKVILDTNVLISGTILLAGPSYRILEAWRQGRFLLVTSEALIAEAQEKLFDPRIRASYHLSRGVIQRMLAALRKHARLVPGRLDLKVIAEDPDDDQVIIAAVEGSVDYIVSGDRHLRDLGAYQGIKILSPAEFARLLEAEPQP